VAEVFGEQAGDMCDYVEQRLGEWAAQDAAAAQPASPAAG
jgi:hypothetical protein